MILLPQTTADIDTDDNPNVILKKAVECMRDNQIKKFQVLQEIW